MLEDLKGRDCSILKLKEETLPAETMVKWIKEVFLNFEFQRPCAQAIFVAS